MGNKTPPLVIPVVIDSTGVDRGLNNVNNRLRRGVGGGMGGGGGGFGSGGGAALGVAAAAGGLGAGVALGARGGGGGFTPTTKAASMSDFRRTMEARSAAFLRSQNKGKASYGSSFDSYGRAILDRFELDPVSERAEAIAGAHARVSRAAANRERLRAAATRRKFGKMLGRVGGAGSAVGAGLGQLGGALATARGLAGMGVAGISAAAVAGGTVGFLKNMPSIADPESVIGSPFYGQLRKTTNFFAQQPKRLGFGQGIIAGANALGGSNSKLNQLGAGTQGMIEKIGMMVGLHVESMMTDPINYVGNALGVESSRQIMRKAILKGLQN